MLEGIIYYKYRIYLVPTSSLKEKILNITGFPNVFGKNCIFVVVDRLTKFSHLFYVITTFTVSQVAELVFKEVFILHGLPKSIVSDKDNIFLSKFWQEIFKMVGKNFTPSTRYHIQNKGQT